MPVQIDELEHVSQMAAKVAWGDVPALAVGEGIEGLQRSIGASQAALLGAVRSYAARSEHRADGHVSVAGWLQHALRMRKGEAHRIARLSRFVDQNPPLFEALAEGRINLDHIDLFARHHRERHAKAWTEVWPRLLDYAEVARFEDVARVVQRFVIGLSPQDADDRFREQIAGRRFTKATTLDGFGHLDGWFDPFTYAIFATEHDRLVQQEFEADWAAARAVLGRDPDPIELRELTRTREQRAADAMRVMAERSKALTGGTVAAAASVVIHMTQDEYEAGLARLMGDDEAEYPADGLSELDDGTPVPPMAGAYLSLIGAFRRIVFGADDEIVSYSKERGYTPVQRAALGAKNRRCCHPYGCDRNGRALQADHIREYSDGGRTHLHNGQCLCGFHNRWKNQHKGDPPRTTRRDRGARRARGPDLC